MSAPLLLDPNYINLHALLHRYFADSCAVFAEFLGLPVRQVEGMVKDSVDIVLVSLISQALAQSPAISLSTTPAKVAFNPDALASFPALPLTQILGQNLDMATHCLMERHTITKATAEKILTPIATFCVYYIDRLAKDGRLSQEQTRLWLGLQSTFLPKATQATARTLGLVLTTIDTGAYSDFAYDKLSFDPKPHKLPNWRWLITLALTVQREDPPVLTQGGAIDFTPQFDYALTPAPKPDFDGRRYAWLGVGIVMVLVGGVFAFKVLQSPSVSQPAPIVQEVEKPIIKDVAIVRVDDKDNKGNKGDKSNKPNTAQQQTAKQDGTSDKKKDSQATANVTAKQDKSAKDAPQAKDKQQVKATQQKDAQQKDNKKAQANTEPKQSAKQPQADTATGKKSQYTLALPPEEKSNYTLGDFLQKK